MKMLLKLKNGVEVIGKALVVESDGVEMEDPFLINYRFAANQPIPTISLSRYMPFAAEHHHYFSRSEIMHEAAPTPAFDSYYETTVTYCKEVIDKSVEDELTSAVAKSPRGKSDLMDIYQAILERTQLDGPLN